VLASLLRGLRLENDDAAHKNGKILESCNCVRSKELHMDTSYNDGIVQEAVASVSVRLNRTFNFAGLFWVKWLNTL